MASESTTATTLWRIAGGLKVGTGVLDAVEGTTAGITLAGTPAAPAAGTVIIAGLLKGINEAVQGIQMIVSGCYKPSPIGMLAGQVVNSTLGIDADTVTHIVDIADDVADAVVPGPSQVTGVLGGLAMLGALAADALGLP